MKAEDKQTLFTLLKTADAYECGYTRDIFATNPEFTDDKIVESSSTMTDSLSSTITDSTNQENKTDTAKENNVENQTAKSPMTLQTLTEKILRCTRCGLARTRNNVVPGMGVEHPEVLVIGEGPGYDEDMQGKPFVGKAGMLLDKMLNAIQLDRNTNCYIANIVKCRPPENRNPFPDEQDACFSFLEAQIHLLKPKMILCMGKIAIEKLMNESISINSQHGIFYDYNGIPVMATYHPSALLRNEQLKRPAWEDLKKFKAKLEELK